MGEVESEAEALAGRALAGGDAVDSAAGEMLADRASSGVAIDACVVDSKKTDVACVVTSRGFPRDCVTGFVNSAGNALTRTGVSASLQGGSGSTGRGSGRTSGLLTLVTGPEHSRSESCARLACSSGCAGAAINKNTSWSTERGLEFGASETSGFIEPVEAVATDDAACKQFVRVRDVCSTVIDPSHVFVGLHVSCAGETRAGTTSPAGGEVIA